MVMFKKLSLHAISYFLVVLTIVNYSRTTDAFRLNENFAAPPNFQFTFWNREWHLHGATKEVIETVVAQCSGPVEKGKSPVLKMTGQGRHLTCKVKKPSAIATKARELADVKKEVVVTPGAAQNVVIFADGKMTSVGWDLNAQEVISAEAEPVICADPKIKREPQYAGIHKVTVQTDGMNDRKVVKVVIKLPPGRRYPSSAVAVQDKARKTFQFCVIDGPETKDKLRVRLSRMPIGLDWTKCKAMYASDAKPATAVSALSMKGSLQYIDEDVFSEEGVPIATVVVQDRKGHQTVFKARSSKTNVSIQKSLKLFRV